MAGMLWRAASATSVRLSLVKDGLPQTTSAPAPAWTILVKAPSNSRSFSAFTATTFRPRVRPASSTSRNSVGGTPSSCSKSIGQKVSEFELTFQELVVQGLAESDPDQESVQVEPISKLPTTVDPI